MASPNPPLEDVLEKLDAFVLFHLRRSDEFGSEECLFERELRHVDEVSQCRLIELHACYVGELMDIIAQGIQRGFFRVCNIDLVAHCMVSMLSGVIIARGSEAVMDGSVTEPVVMLCRKLIQVEQQT